VAGLPRYNVESARGGRCSLNHIRLRAAVTAIRVSHQEISESTNGVSVSADDLVAHEIEVVVERIRFPPELLVGELTSYGKPIECPCDVIALSER